MCGIAGAAWTRDQDAVAADTIDRMLACLRHRGPDAGGTQRCESPGRPAAFLGQRRLSILDLSDAGRQPMTLAHGPAAGRVWISFNGEIYNYRELRDELLVRGHRFASETDTEVLLAAYVEYGDDCVSHLRGMFAFAIWDDRDDGSRDAGGPRLLLARDRMGQKPLHYRHDPGGGSLLFASELKSLLAAGVPRRIDRRSLALYLTYQYVPHPRSILDGCAKLPPGHRAVWANGQLTVEPYWTAPFDEPIVGRSVESWRTELRDTLTESVRLRMRSDVPIGAFLSGGVDSSITAGLMQSLSDKPIHTFSIGFPSAAYDETEYAKMAAEKLGTNHHVDIVDPAAMRDLPRLVWHYDEPFGDSSALPTTYVSHFARRFVTVALSGDGGDELFAGYNRYRAVQLANRLDRFPGRWPFRLPIWKLLPKHGSQKSLLHRARRFAEGLAEEHSDRYLKWISHFDMGRLRDFLAADVVDELGDFTTASLIRDAYRAGRSRDLVTQTCFADVQTYLPCDILTKVDIASMSASLECRSPFLDHRVVELASRMPVEMKLDRSRQKAILIDTFADLLPPPIRTRSKMGFGVPIGEWFRGELRPLIDGVLLSDRALGRGLFRPDAVRELVREHQSEEWNHQYRLWTLLMLELWQRAYVDGDVPLDVDALSLDLPGGLGEPRPLAAA